MKFLKLIPLLIALCLVGYYNEDITEYIIENFIYYNESVYIEKPNEYKLDYNFEYVKNIDDFHITNKKQLINALYTILNSGTNDFYFYCEYAECEKDVNEIASDETLSTINNYVHPYNSYKKVYLTINAQGKVNIKFEKTYNYEEILLTEKSINDIMNSLITDNMTNKEKIIAFHDYIINITKYDSAYVNDNLDDINSPSHKATGILLYNKALCGGYADIMNIFLNKLKIPNFLIASEYHVWNAVYLDNTWYHLDLTWDDPVTKDGSNIRLEKFLLITDEKLTSYNTGYHDYKKEIYSEFNLLER